MGDNELVEEAKESLEEGRKQESEKVKKGKEKHTKWRKVKMKNVSPAVHLGE